MVIEKVGRIQQALMQSAPSSFGQSNLILTSPAASRPNHNLQYNLLLHYNGARGFGLLANG